MGLFQKAVETYDAMKNIAGVETEGSETLVPIGFLSAKAQILIELTENGDFIKAERIYDEKTDSKEKTQKADKRIIIPATEKSSGRTVSAASTPHPLCDKLMFFCPDYKVSYEAYIKQLSEWCQSEYAVPQIKAVLTYVQRGSVRTDLATLENVKDEELVCFRVLSTNDTGYEEIWRNTNVINAYINYCKHNSDCRADKSLCYVNGRILPSAGQHLKGIVPKFGNAKLISANDSVNYTYRGRFISDSEALSVSYEVSQKAHNALKWVVANEGVKLGDRVMVSWNPRGAETVKPHNSIFPKKNVGEDKLTPTNFRDALSKIINGYKGNFKPGDQTVTAVFGAATTGRLSLSYYSELRAEDYLERLKYWDESCAWEHRIFGVTAPNLRSMVDAAYGTLRNGVGDLQIVETDEKTVAAITQRLLLCRLEKSPFPADIMRAAVQKCASLQLYEPGATQHNREWQVFVTCSMIKKYRFDHFKEEWSMALEPEKKNRSYQYGRLLAVMEKAERDTYESEEKREPNAIRMQPVYVKRPMYAAKIVLEQLKNAYFPKLSVGARVYYDKLIGEIMLMISECAEAESIKPLGEEYLIGYYLQKNELYKKKNTNINNDTEENE